MNKSIFYTFIAVLVLYLSSCSKSEDQSNCTVNPPVVDSAKIEQLAEFVNKNYPNALLHSQGFYYEIIADGNRLNTPTACSDIVVNYSGTLDTNQEFDSGSNVAFSLRSLISGWRVALPLIGEGGIIRIILPSELAYGQNGIDNIIPQNATTIFKIELLEVQ